MPEMLILAKICQSPVKTILKESGVFVERELCLVF